jgi:hypothetical protein
MNVEAVVDTSSQQVFLVRHGDTDGSLSGHRTGVSDDIPLSEHARHMARRWGPVLARERFALVLTSPHGESAEAVRARVAGHHFLLDTATLNILSHDNGIPTIKRWNAPLGPPADETLEDA